MLASPKNGVRDLSSWMKDKVKMPNDHQLRDGPQHSSNCEIFWHIMPMVMTMFMMTGRIPGPEQDNAGEVFIIGLFTTAPLISGHCIWCTRPVLCILITTRHSSIFVQIAPNLKIFDLYVPTTTSWSSSSWSSSGLNMRGDKADRGMRAPSKLNTPMISPLWSVS